MEYKLKNGEFVTIRLPKEEDAEKLLHLLDDVSYETKFLANNPGEVLRRYTVGDERRIIKQMNESPYHNWFVVEYKGEIVGQCSVEAARTCERERHRGYLGLFLKEEACNIGIGGKMMEELLYACRTMNMSQAELSVVCDNYRAINMYLSFGFTVCGTKPRALRYTDGSYADEYCMIKYLDD